LFTLVEGVRIVVHSTGFKITLYDVTRLAEVYVADNEIGSYFVPIGRVEQLKREFEQAWAGYQKQSGVLEGVEDGDCTG
jgi:hypothetical protein